jgi:hypothetical protein
LLFPHEMGLGASAPDQHGRPSEGAELRARLRQELVDVLEEKLRLETERHDKMTLEAERRDKMRQATDLVALLRNLGALPATGRIGVGTLCARWLGDGFACRIDDGHRTVAAVWPA